MVRLCMGFLRRSTQIPVSIATATIDAVSGNYMFYVTKNGVGEGMTEAITENSVNSNETIFHLADFAFLLVVQLTLNWKGSWSRIVF